jgi:hypothetical protein
MKTSDAGKSIADLPLDLFGGVDAPVPAEVVVREPDIFCWECQAMLTEGLATCPQCGAQNELIPIVTSSPPSPYVLEGEPSGSYASRVAFAFTYMLRDIARLAGQYLSAVGHQILDWSIHGSRSRKRRRR